jgi:hypothetical protein
MTYQRVLPLTFQGVMGDPASFSVQFPFKTFFASQCMPCSSNFCCHFAPSRLHSPLIQFTHVFRKLIPTSYCQAVIAHQGLPRSYRFRYFSGENPNRLLPRNVRWRIWKVVFYLSKLRNLLWYDRSHSNAWGSPFMDWLIVLVSRSIPNEISQKYKVWTSIF